MKQRIAKKLVSISSKPGPKTQAAIDKVKGNAYVHGLTAQHLTIHESDQPHYDKMTQGFRLRFRPADVFEDELLQRIIDTNWRLTICASVESSMLADLAFEPQDNLKDKTRVTFMKLRARTFTNEANAFGVLGRYEAGLQRRFHAMLRELEAAIANRPEPAVEPAPAEPAEPFVMAAAACSQPQQNTPSSPEIDSFRSTAESGSSALTAIPVLNLSPHHQNIQPEQDNRIPGPVSASYSMLHT